MKQYRAVVSVVVLFLLTSSMGYSQKKVALVSFYCNKYIENGGPGMDVFISDSRYEIKPTVEKAYKKFLNEYAKNLPFTVIPHSEVASNPQYPLFKSRFMVDSARANKDINKIIGLNSCVTPDGLVPAYGGPKLFTKMENFDPYILGQMFDDVDGVMIISIDYKFQSRAMGFAAGMVANMNVSLFKSNGEKVFIISEGSSSKGKVPAVGGIPILKSEKIVLLCQDATDVLFKELKGKLPKIIKKSAKKFN